jgi:hypothetical protein
LTVSPSATVSRTITDGELVISQVL